ncbi:Eukaryotic translation initiation factor 4E-1 [Nymphaea thermarum]|nr:Eukaryotic translation initiation factor 4E-1 [Nymphaea thermarum]
MAEGEEAQRHSSEEATSEGRPATGASAEDTEVEDGEIVDDGSGSAASAVERPIEIVHPLEHSWTFWFDNPSGKNRQSTWGSSIRAIHTFSTVEEFWGLYNNIIPPSKLVAGADFHCFKNKIEPKWEDPVCSNGGKWSISCSRGKADKWWLYTRVVNRFIFCGNHLTIPVELAPHTPPQLLAMIGEQFSDGDEICGAVVNVRAKQDKIALWTKNAANQTAQISIGKEWKEFLDYNDTIGFIVHDDAKKLDRLAKSRYNI